MVWPIEVPVPALQLILAYCVMFVSALICFLLHLCTSHKYQLRILYSKHTDLNVKTNNEKSWDYTVGQYSKTPQDGHYGTEETPATPQVSGDASVFAAPAILLGNGLVRQWSMLMCNLLAFYLLIKVLTMSDHMKTLHGQPLQQWVVGPRDF